MFFFFKQKTAYELRISDWSSDVCSSDLSFAPASIASPPEPGRSAAMRPAARKERASFGGLIHHRSGKPAGQVGGVDILHAPQFDGKAKVGQRRLLALLIRPRERHGHQEIGRAHV